MLRPVLDNAANALELAGSLCGVPYVGAAAIVLRDIVKACDEVRVHKKKSRQIRDKCIQLIIILNDQAPSLEGTELWQTLDEAKAMLERIEGRVKRWSRLNSVSTFLKNAEIGEGLDRCDSELDMAMQFFNINAQIIMVKAQRDQREATAYNHNEIRDLLLLALTSKSETQQIITMQNSGEHVAERLMEAGQQELRHLRGTSHYNLIIANERSTSPVPANMSPSSVFSSGSHDSQHYLEYQRALINLHQATGIPPTVKILDGEVIKIGELAIAGGTYSDIWLGQWLGEQKVALKALRNIKASDKKAQKHFEHEITMWSGLKNDHILPFYGIVTNLGQHIHMVSPWQEHGNVLDYIKHYSDTNRLHLIAGAADGLEYLHSEKIVHGNVKCANILVSSLGEACICDFGMSKVIEEVTEKSASATLTAGGSARWLAPELIEGVVSSPTMAADTYSFAMAVLELLTGKHPFYERKRDASVIHDVVLAKKTPVRPRDAAASLWLTDVMWSLMQDCWHNTASLRPSMTDVKLGINKMVMETK